MCAKRVRNAHGQGGRLREELIEAAGRVLAATPDGSELSLRAVAREAGIAAPSVYLQFADKAELVRTVIGAHFDELRATINQAMASEPDPVRRLRAGCIAYCRFALDHPGKYRVLFQHLLEDEGGLGDFGSPTDRGALAFGTLVDGIQRCIDSGDAPPGDAFGEARLLWPAMHGYVTLVPIRRGFPWFSVDDQIDALLTSIVGVPRAKLGPGSPSPQVHPAPNPGNDQAPPVNGEETTMTDHSHTTLPENLPVPQDDGAADHLAGIRLPSVPLTATDGVAVDLSTLPGRTVVYAYPRTGRPDRANPAGWDAIPGARGCTPQSCSYRDHHAELAAAGARVFGLSTQDTAYQREAVARLHLPFPLLSDENLAFTTALKLPTFEVEIDGEPQTLLRRLTMIVTDGTISHVFYPVFPPDADAEQVIAWLREHPA